ncbi:MAG: DegT/DnrJ/EryC1/StrS family aminotransferase, partial [Dehalococcoidia bacterium]
STSDAIRHIGAEPVFVDIDPISRNLDPNELEGVVNARTKAIVAVHLHGKPADMGRMMGIGHRYGIRVVESATEALGARYLGRQVGAIGDIACFGCDQHDMLSSGGDAGIVITSAPDLAAALDEVAGFGSPSPHRLHPLRAAVLRVKLRWLDHDSQVRRQLGYEYQQALAGAPVGLPAEDRSTQHGYGMFVIRSAFREYLMQCLLSSQVGTGIHYPIPLHLSLSSRYLNYAPGDFPESEQASREVLSLPLHPDMDAADVRYVSESVTAALDFVSR